MIILVCNLKKISNFSFIVLKSGSNTLLHIIFTAYIYIPSLPLYTIFDLIICKLLGTIAQSCISLFLFNQYRTILKRNRLIYYRNNKIRRTFLSISLNLLNIFCSMNPSSPLTLRENVCYRLTSFSGKLLLVYAYITEAFADC